MTFLVRDPVVKQLPETLNQKQGRLILKEFESCMDLDRPCIVLDCSLVRDMDRCAILLLLCCLEEAMKRNGDVKLAGVAAETMEILKLNGLDHLFEVFNTNADALSSFYRLRKEEASRISVPNGAYGGAKM